jgi:hypothetical protein
MLVLSSVEEGVGSTVSALVNKNEHKILEENVENNCA